MFGWLRRMFDAAYGAVDNTVRSWVSDLVTGVYGFLHMVFGDVHGAWNVFEASALNLWHGTERFARYVTHSLIALYRIVIPAVIREYRKLFGEVSHALAVAYRYILSRIEYLIRLIAATARALWSQVIRDVWNPLFKSLTLAWHWITHEGATVYFYITHPDKLIDLVWASLLAKLEREAWNAGALLGKFFLALIIRNLRRFALLIEDILDAVL